MARYTLKTFYRTKLVERYEHRSKHKLVDILAQDKMHRAGETDPCGNLTGAVDLFEIFDNNQTRIFSGNIADAESFAKKLK